MFIGIAGKARSGKNTVSEMIMFLLTTPKRKHTYAHYCRKSDKWRNLLYTKHNIIAFATSLKQIAAILSCRDANELICNDIGKTCLVPNHIQDDTNNITYRKLYQTIGDMFRNQFSPSIWVSILYSKYYNNMLRATDPDYNEHILISDVRYRIESDFIEANNGIVIKIEAPNNVNDTHSSEQLNDIIPYKVIFNDKTGLESLFNNVKKTVYELI